jgi:hypothetical protein
MSSNSKAWTAAPLIKAASSRDACREVPQMFIRPFVGFSPRTASRIILEVGIVEPNIPHPNPSRMDDFILPTPSGVKSSKRRSHAHFASLRAAVNLLDDFKDTVYFATSTEDKYNSCGGCSQGCLLHLVPQLRLKSFLALSPMIFFLASFERKGKSYT